MNFMQDKCLLFLDLTIFDFEAEMNRKKIAGPCKIV